MSYSRILFDLDGTLTDSGPGILNSVRHAIRAMDLPRPNDSDLRKFIGPPLHESFMHFCSLDREGARQAVACYREYYAETGIFENTLYEGVTELLRDLDTSGKTIILATSKPSFYADQILKHFEILDFFSRVVGSEMDGTRTCKIELIREIVGDLPDSERRRTLMVGDREHDIIGARRNEIDSVGVTYGYGSREELFNAGATHLVDSPWHLGAFLARDAVGLA